MIVCVLCYALFVLPCVSAFGDCVCLSNASECVGVCCLFAMFGCRCLVFVLGSL